VIALRPDNPLIVQSDRTLLLEVAHPAFEQVRDELARFAELVKSPEHIHTYRITPLSLWNASASGVTCEEMASTLNRWSKYPVPQNLLQEIQDHGTRYGRLRLVQKGERLALEMDDRGLFYELENQRSLQGMLAEPYPDQRGIYLEDGMRGEVKLHLIRLGHPVQDLAGFKPGDPLAFELRPRLAGTGKRFGLRPYQQAAVDVFHAGGGPEGGAGVLVLESIEHARARGLLPPKPGYFWRIKLGLPVEVPEAVLKARQELLARKNGSTAKPGEGTAQPPCASTTTEDQNQAPVPGSEQPELGNHNSQPEK